MLIDIHRHANDKGTADLVVRNLFHSQSREMENDRFYSIGLHPWHVNEKSLKEDIQKVRESAGDTKVIAIGEAGLDKAIDTPFEIQERAFHAQAEIALEVNKPMVIHCVRAYNEVFSFKLKLKDTNPWIIHWFNATQEMGEQLIARNFYLSFGHILFNDRSKAYHAFPHIPIEKVFFETDDAGYSIDQVYERAASLRGINIDILQQQIQNNFTRCFGIAL